MSRFLHAIGAAGAVIGLSYAPASAGEKPAPFQLALNVNVVGANALQPTQPAGTPTPQKMAFSLAGVPVTIGTKEAPLAKGIALQAGMRGDYRLDIGDHLVFTAAADITRTRSADDTTPGDAWGTDRATGLASLRYVDDGFTFAAEPVWRLTAENTAFTAQEYGSLLRIAQRLPMGFDISGGVGYLRHDALLAADDETRLRVSGGIGYRLPGRFTAAFTYTTTYELADKPGASPLSFAALGEAANSTGPSLSMSLPLSDALDLTAALSYCTSTDALPDHGNRDTETRQSLDIAAAWRDDAPGGTGLNLTAAYAYDRIDGSARATEVNHAATLALVMPF